jgi:outer membrane protein TolC
VAETNEQQVVRKVREKADQLEQLLDDFSNRLRRMRERNRQLEAEITSFDEGLERLRTDVLEARDDIS